LGVYGASKLAGEQAIQAVAGEHLVLRTSWVYSRHGRNFLLTMQRLLQERDQLSVVADEIGAPTWARSIARATGAMIRTWRNLLVRLCLQHRRPSAAAGQTARTHRADPFPRLPHGRPAPAQLAARLLPSAARLGRAPAGLGKRAAGMPGRSLRCPAGRARR